MKIVLTLLILLFFAGCAQPTALLGPIYTIGNCIDDKIFFPQSKFKAKKFLKLPLKS